MSFAFIYILFSIGGEDGPKDEPKGVAKSGDVNEENKEQNVKENGTCMDCTKTVCNFMQHKCKMEFRFYIF